MGLLPYCSAGKPTAVNKKQLRYALACIPWKAKGVSPKDVERQFTALSHKKVKESRVCSATFRHQNEEAQVLQLFLKDDGSVVSWGATLGRNVKKAPTKWYTRVDEGAHKSIDINQPTSAQWDKPNSLLKGLTDFMRGDKRLRCDLLYRHAIEALLHKARDEAVANGPKEEALQRQLFHQGNQSHWHRVFTMPKYRLLEPEPSNAGHGIGPGCGSRTASGSIHSICSQSVPSNHQLLETIMGNAIEGIQWSLNVERGITAVQNDVGCTGNQDSKPWPLRQ